MPVITISRQLGSLGTEISQLLCKEFDCTYLDKESLEEMFTQLGAPTEAIDRFDERKPTFWDLFRTDKARYLHYLSGAIYEFANKEGGVILGRGGQVLLGELPGVLNVRVIAPIDVRTERIIERYSCDERQAQQFIQHSDSERAGFHKFFFDIDLENHNLYDLVINTGSLSPDCAVRMIEDVVGSEEFIAKKELTQRKLADYCLQYEITTGIIYENKILIQFLEVISENGKVTLRGIVESKEDIFNCEKVASKVKGVSEVNNEIYYSPITTTYGVHY